MRKLGLTAAVAVLTVLAAAPAVGASRLTTVGVQGTEFDLVPTRNKVDAGKARIQFQNKGEDPHDLVIQRKGDEATQTTDEVMPGGNADLFLKLKQDSKYVMWCSIEGHRELGMETTIKVRRK